MIQRNPHFLYSDIYFGSIDELEIANIGEENEEDENSCEFIFDFQLNHETNQKTGLFLIFSDYF